MSYNNICSIYFAISNIKIKMHNLINFYSKFVGKQKVSVLSFKNIKIRKKTQDTLFVLNIQVLKSHFWPLLK